MVIYLLESVHRHLFLFQKYLSIKLSSFLDPCFSDCSISISDSFVPAFSFSQALYIIDQALEVLGLDYHQFLHEHLDKGHVDTLVSDKKHPTIVFTWYAYSFMQFRESFIDVKNLAHEIGHLMNDAYSILENPFVYVSSSNFIGEIIAIVNETLLMRFFIDHATTKEEQIFYLSKEIENYVSSVIRPMMFQEFEDYLSESSFTMDFEACCNAFEELLHRYYGTCVHNISELREEWLQYDKYYRVCYYSYTYVSGKLIANSIVDLLLRGDLAVSDYLKFLKSGNAKSVTELFQLLHLSLEDSSLFDRGFAFLEHDIELLESLLS